MTSHLRPAISLIVLFTALLGLGFPLLFVGIGQTLFPGPANGSLVHRDGQVIGSALIGQEFTGPGYFHARPSAITGTDPKDPSKTVATPYDASTSSASNLGPTSRALHDRVGGDAAQLRKEGATGSIPADAVTSSGSGLDPDISPENAMLQAPRVAEARHLAPETLARIIRQQTQAPLLGVLGAPRVNVLRLNLALDAAGTKS